VFFNNRNSVNDYKHQKNHPVYAFLSRCYVPRRITCVTLTYHRGNVCLRDDSYCIGGLGKKFGCARRPSVRVQQKHACPPLSLISRRRSLCYDTAWFFNWLLYKGQRKSSHGNLKRFSRCIRPQIIFYGCGRHRFIVTCLFCESDRPDVSILL